MKPAWLRVAWLAVGAWLVTLADAAPRLGESAFEVGLAVIALVGLAGALLWLRGRHRLALGAAALYVVYYAVRLYVQEVEPLLAVLSLPQAIADAFYVTWSWPAGRLSHGEVLDATRELWRRCVMPLLQLGVLAVAARGR